MYLVINKLCFIERKIIINEKESCIQETNKHIDLVGNLIGKIVFELNTRSLFHDESKLNEPEIEGFIEYTPKLKNCTYGTEEYKRYLKELKPYLDHHYGNNSHHPEHFKNGISGMNLIDIIEMFCDWYAATKRHADGDIYKSIEINKNRFGYDDVLGNVFKNTVKILEEKNDNKNIEDLKDGYTGIGCFKCTHCGEFIAHKDFSYGSAIMKMITPDSEYSVEEFEQLCKKCIEKEKNNG